MKRKKMHLAMYVSLLMLCGSLTLCARESPSRRNRPIPGTAIFVMSEQQELQLKTRQFTVHKPYLQLEMQIPQFSGLKDAKKEQLLNRQLVQSARKRKKEILEQAERYHKDLSQDGLETLLFEYQENFRTIPSQSPFFVVEQDRYYYSGGAHGLYELSYLVIDTEQSRLTTLMALFKPQVNYKGVIDQEVNRLIEEKRQTGAYFFSGSDGFKGIREDQPFYVDAQGNVVIVFNVYEIAPYAAGPQHMVIPREKLAPYLK